MTPLLVMANDSYCSNRVLDKKYHVRQIIKNKNMKVIEIDQNQAETGKGNAKFTRRERQWLEFPVFTLLG